MVKISYCILFVAFAVFSSCQSTVQKAPADTFGAERIKQETLINMNTYVARRNQELIERFVSRTGLNLKVTGSGLWYGIYSFGTGVQAVSGNTVEIIYKLKLLDGTDIDSVTERKPKIFKLGKGGLEAGIEEGILLLHQGDSALFIIPPHLAFGNFGDQQKIPPGAILFYDLYLVSVKP